VVPFTQVPLPSQLCGVRPVHCLAPGLHVPEHDPPLQTLAHAAPLTQLPVASQLWGVSPLQRLLVGVQLPVHEPPTQADVTHVMAVPH
jgi:hypothetical protein